MTNRLINGSSNRSAADLFSPAKQAKAQFSTLDAPDAADGNSRPPIQHQAQRRLSKKLTSITHDVTLFHAPDKQAYATIEVDGHLETYMVDSAEFRRWLTLRYYRQTKSAPPAAAIKRHLRLAEARACFDGPQIPVFTRLGQCGDAIYLDLCNRKWSAVKITKDGWKIVSPTNVRFRRTQCMRPLPNPVRGGSIDELRPFLNIANEDDFVLTTGEIVGFFNPRGPFALTALLGEHGTSKSMRMRAMLHIVDPQEPAIRGAPRTEEDLVIAASNCRVIALDNLSSISHALSDALCRMTTGGGFGRRRFFTNTEETVIEVSRPVIINGIEDLVTRSDLLDRTILHRLEEIPPNCRIPERRFWENFQNALPRILGVFLDAVSVAMRNLPTVRLPELPRMADFVAWVTAAEPALGWEPGTFLSAYQRNRSEAHQTALEASPLAQTLLDFLRHHHSTQRVWEMSPTDWWKTLKDRAENANRSVKSWPGNAKALSDAIRRIAPNLRHIGIHVDWRRNSSSDRSRFIRFQLTEEFLQNLNTRI